MTQEEMDQVLTEIAEEALDRPNDSDWKGFIADEIKRRGLLDEADSVIKVVMAGGASKKDAAEKALAAVGMPVAVKDERPHATLEQAQRGAALLALRFKVYEKMQAMQNEKT